VYSILVMVAKYIIVHACNDGETYAVTGAGSVCF